MRIADINGNDIVDAIDGIAVSLWTVGCPHHCKGCQNSELWDYNAGKDYEIDDIVDKLEYAISKSHIYRSLSILGGEPLCEENIYDVNEIIKRIRASHPDIFIYVWSGYTKEQLEEKPVFQEILSNINYFIDGPYVESLRDTRLVLRGSSNQRIWVKSNDEWGLLKERDRFAC